MSTNLPLLFSANGPVPTPPATIQQAIIVQVEAAAPGYTSALPGSLIDDVLGTDVAACVVSDQARVDAVNSVTPGTANPYILAQLGQMFGFPQGSQSNGSVFVVFAGTPGYVIPPGFIIGDGTNQYAIQDGGTIATNGFSQSLYAVATNSNTFAIPAGAVNVIITSVPSPYTLTVTNALAGTPALAPETIESYRARLIGAWQAPIQGMATYLKTLLLAVPGVSPQLVSVRQLGVNWEIICGGGDPYQVAGAIYIGVGQIGLLTGSPISSGRNVNVSIYDAPDTYEVIYVNPPQQNVTLSVLWNTQQLNFTSGPLVDQYIIEASGSYLNSIIVGQPINLLVLQEQIQTAIAPILPAASLTTLKFAFTINSDPAEPTAGTSIIPSDPESYFYCSPSGVTSAQG